MREGTGLCNRGCNDSELDLDDEEDVRINGVFDDIMHILFTCDKLQRLRAKWTREIISRGGKWELNGMFTGREVFQAVVGFLREARLCRNLVY